MKYRICGLILALLLTINISCLDESAETGGKGVLNVTVNVDTSIWEYPKFTEGTCAESFFEDTGDFAGTWYYPAVGGDGDPTDEESLFDDPILSTEVGDKNIIVYLYSALGESSDTYSVLFKGTSLDNNATITINKIVAGTYYVVAFYDYRTGGEQTNLLNRYDRYAIYTDNSSALDGTANSSPYKDKAVSIEITDDTPSTITLEIKRDWVLGKPKITGGTGRIFLVEDDGIPDPYTAAK